MATMPLKERLAALLPIALRPGAGGGGELGEGWTPPAYSPELVRKLLPYLAPLYRYYFRCEMRGLERIPPAPAFIVANHNAMGIVEIPMMIYGWYTHFGFDRPARGLTHNWLFKTPVTRSLLPRIGSVPAAPDVAQRTLEAGQDLLVFPGGDWEAGRPLSERGEVTLAGRKGFVRVALKTGAPVVPTVICGAHETALIFSRGDTFARWSRIDKTLRMKVSPVTPQSFLLLWKIFSVLTGGSTIWTLPLYILNTQLFLPWLPSKIVMEFLDPIDLRKELTGIEDENERVEKGYELVVSRMQAKMDELQAERKTFLG